MYFSYSSLAATKQDRIACVKFDSVAGSSILALRSILAHPVNDWIEVEKNLGNFKVFCA